METQILKNFFLLILCKINKDSLYDKYEIKKTDIIKMNLLIKIQHSVIINKNADVLILFFNSFLIIFAQSFF